MYYIHVVTIMELKKSYYHNEYFNVRHLCPEPPSAQRNSTLDKYSFIIEGPISRFTKNIGFWHWRIRFRWKTAIVNIVSIDSKLFGKLSTIGFDMNVSDNILRYPTPQCCSFKNLLKSKSWKSVGKISLKNTKIIGGSVFIPLGYGPFVLFFLYHFARWMQFQPQLLPVFFIMKTYFFKYCFLLCSMIKINKSFPKKCLKVHKFCVTF